MKFPHPLIGFIAILFMSANGVCAATFGIGKPAPDFMFKDINGKTQSISQYRGKTIVLDWVDTQCSFDLKHYNSGNIPSMQKQAKADGIVWLSINSAAPGEQGDFGGDQLTAWLKKVNWSADSYIRDQAGVVGKMYHATATPGMYVIKKDGTLAYAGAIDSIASNDVADIAKATNYVKQALAEIAAGKPVSVPFSRQYGCTIKYAS